jgi:hypothetical protein
VNAQHSVDDHVLSIPQLGLSLSLHKISHLQECDPQLVQRDHHTCFPVGTASEPFRYGSCPQKRDPGQVKRDHEALVAKARHLTFSLQFQFAEAGPGAGKKGPRGAGGQGARGDGGQHGQAQPAHHAREDGDVPHRGAVAGRQEGAPAAERCLETSGQVPPSLTLLLLVTLYPWVLVLHVRYNQAKHRPADICLPAIVLVLPAAVCSSEEAKMQCTWLRC